MLRVAICQPLIPRYRVPVFHLLGLQEEIDLTLFAGRTEFSERLQREGSPSFNHVVCDEHLLPWPLCMFRYQTCQWSMIDPQRFDLVILPWWAWYVTLWPAMLRASRSEVPVVLWGHGYSKRPGFMRDQLRNTLGRLADAVLVYSHGVRQRLIDSGAYTPEHVFAAPNAIDQRPIRSACEHWLNRPDELAAFQQQHNLDPRCTIIHISRLLEANRPDMLLHGLVKLRDTEPHARLVIVGDGPARPELEQLANDLNIREYVVFTGAIFDDMDMAPWALSSTLYCYPVNIGLGILHAFGFKLPVVTSDNFTRQNPEIEALEPETNGLVYRDGDLDHMVDTWKQIIDDPALRQRLSNDALQTVSEDFTLPNMIQGFLDLTRLVDGKQRLVRDIDQPWQPPSLKKSLVRDDLVR